MVFQWEIGKVGGILRRVTACASVLFCKLPGVYHGARKSCKPNRWGAIWGYKVGSPTSYEVTYGAGGLPQF